MKKVLFLILLAGIGYGIVKLPANLVLPHVLPKNAAVQLEDISGTVWQGRAGRVLRQGQDLGQLGWRVHPKSLLSGVIDADLVLNGGAYTGNGRVMRSSEGGLRFVNTRLDFPASELNSALDIPALQMQGAVKLELDTLEIYNYVPVEMKGRATWSDAAVSGQEQARLGTLKTEFGNLPEGGFGGTLSDEGGPLALDGNFKLALTGYEVDARLSARDGNPQVQGVLRHIGQPQEDGSVHYLANGSFFGRR